MFANYMIGLCYRNGPIESIHAGHTRALPLDQRRITLAQEKRVLGFAAGRMRYVALTLTQLEQQTLPWAELMMPYALPNEQSVSRWSLTEKTREAFIPGTLTCDPTPEALRR